MQLPIALPVGNDPEDPIYNLTVALDEWPFKWYFEARDEGETWVSPLTSIIDRYIGVNSAMEGAWATLGGSETWATTKSA